MFQSSLICHLPVQRSEFERNASTLDITSGVFLGNLRILCLVAEVGKDDACSRRSSLVDHTEVSGYTTLGGDQLAYGRMDQEIRKS
jgi:hypothetical protein